MTKRFLLDKGLDLPIAGEPRQDIEGGPAIRTVALVGDDYYGMKPTMEVVEGDTVKLGQLLFTDKKTEGVKYTSPGAGKVVAVNRGAKRKFESVVIELDGEDEVTFASYPDENLAMLDRDKVQENLIESGLWTAIRTRPFSKVPAPETAPYAMFITAMDTNPLAVDPVNVINQKPAEFIAGLQVLSTLTDGDTWLCKKPGTELPGEDLGCLEVAEFSGPHPAGLPGTHMHFLAPVSLERASWDVNYQDVIAIGHLFLTGKILTDRVVSVAGPAVTNARSVRSRIGASLEELCKGSGAPTEGVRTVSGSVLSGRESADMRNFLGRRHLQVTQLIEGTYREFIGWMLPGFSKFSVTNVFASSWIPSTVADKFKFTTSTEGSHRAIVPLGKYEKVVPLDIIPTPLLKSLCTGDTDELQMLGGLELDEEDLGLCSFVCSSKNEYGPMLREALTRIEKDG